MNRGDRHPSRTQWEHDVELLVEHGRDCEAVQLAARQLASDAEAGRSSEPTQDHEEE